VRDLGSHRKRICSRYVGDVRDGFNESSFRSNWDDLKNRHEDDWENVRGMGARQIPLSASRRNGPGRKRYALWIYHALHHWGGARDHLRARLGSINRRTCISGMGTSLWPRDYGSLPVLRLSFHGVGCI